MVWWNRYIGIPFKEKGRELTQCDCWGLVRLIYGIEREIELPSYSELYASTEERQRLGDAILLEKQESWREISSPEPFDAILLRMAGVPMHVGLVTKPLHMIHCARDIGTVHERYDSLRWKNKVAGFFRYE